MAAGATPPAWVSQPPLRFTHMERALATAFKSATVALLASLPQHQQLVLCTMVCRMRRLRKEAEEAAEAASQAAKAVAMAAAAEAEALAAEEEEDEAMGDTANANRSRAASAGGSSTGAAAASRIAERAAKAAALAASAASGHERCSIGTLAGEYAKLCVKQRLPALSNKEVMPLCESLAVCGLVALSGGSSAAGTRKLGGLGRVGGGVDPMERSVWLCVSDGDLRLATEQLHLFRQILTR